MDPLPVFDHREKVTEQSQVNADANERGCRSNSEPNRGVQITGCNQIKHGQGLLRVIHRGERVRRNKGSPQRLMDGLGHAWGCQSRLELAGGSQPLIHLRGSLLAWFKLGNECVFILRRDPIKAGILHGAISKSRSQRLTASTEHTQREKIEFGGRHGSLSGQIRSLEPLSIRLKLALDGGAWVHVMTTTQKFLQPDCTDR